MSLLALPALTNPVPVTPASVWTSTIWIPAASARGSRDALYRFTVTSVIFTPSPFSSWWALEKRERLGYSTPAWRARSAIFLARVRCGMSIIWPFQAKAPAPRAACSSNAAMRATASSADSREGVNS